MITRNEAERITAPEMLGEIHWLTTKNSVAYARLRRKTYSDLIHFSIGDALVACTAAQEDEIRIVPGYTETITGVGGLALNKAGIKIKGLGLYDYRPKFLMDGAATVSCLVTAANILLENCVFIAGHSDVAVFATITAKGFKLLACRFEGNTTDENFVTIINAGAADNDCDGLHIESCVMDYGVDNGALNPIILNKNTESVRILDNRIFADLDTTPYAAIYSPNTEHHMDIDIGYNQIHNLHDANAVVGISVGSTTSTGFMHHNMVYALDVAGASPFVSAATGIALIENYYNFVGDTTQGYLDPVASTLA